MTSTIELSYVHKPAARQLLNTRLLYKMKGKLQTVQSIRLKKISFVLYKINISKRISYLQKNVR
jgi:hypothetical protein